MNTENSKLTLFFQGFKKYIKFIVSIVASREFAFLYCVLGTIAQTAHTYYLLDGISSLSGTWKMVQTLILSFFISSSLLYFTAISDNNDQTPSGKRVLKAVALFMYLEIIINLYYYSKHIVIETNNYNTDNLFQLAFGILIACIIPITIKLYSSQIRAKEWLIDDNEFNNTNSTRNNINQGDLNNIKNEIDKINSTIENFNIEDINNKIKESFNKNSELFLNQYKNKLKMLDSTQQSQ